MSGGCHVMDLGWCVSCDEFKSVSGFGGGVSGGCHVMDLGWCVSCDGFGVSQDLEVVCQEDVM